MAFDCVKCAFWYIFTQIHVKKNARENLYTQIFNPNYWKIFKPKCMLVYYIHTSPSNFQNNIQLIPIAKICSCISHFASLDNRNTRIHVCIAFQCIFNQVFRLYIYGGELEKLGGGGFYFVVGLRTTGNGKNIFFFFF